jgi:hypothetical protein
MLYNSANWRGILELLTGTAGALVRISECRNWASCYVSFLKEAISESGDDDRGPSNTARSGSEM